VATALTTTRPISKLAARNFELTNRERAPQTSERPVRARRGHAWHARISAASADTLFSAFTRFLERVFIPRGIGDRYSLRGFFRHFDDYGAAFL